MSAPNASDQADFLVSKVFWWVLILFGMGLVAVLAFSPSAFGWWYHNITTVLPQTLFVRIFGVAVFLHLFEAGIAAVLAKRAGLPALPWTLQTIMLGYASLGPLRGLIARRKQSQG